MPKHDIAWLKKPEDDDYANALKYLSLIAAPKSAARLIKALHKAKPLEWEAKDLLRAAALSPLPRDNPHVADDLEKIHKGRSLAPILLVRGDMANGVPLTIADGYHRISATYHYHEKAPIPCRIVDGEG